MTLLKCFGARESHSSWGFIFSIRWFQVLQYSWVGRLSRNFLELLQAEKFDEARQGRLEFMSLQEKKDVRTFGPMLSLILFIDERVFWMRRSSRLSIWDFFRRGSVCANLFTPCTILMMSLCCLFRLEMHFPFHQIEMKYSRCVLMSQLYIRILWSL